MTNTESQELNPLFKLFFNLNKSKTSVEELQQWLFDAGFDELFTDQNNKALLERINNPEKGIDYGYETGVIEALFGGRVRSINVREPYVDEICDFSAYLLNSIKPSLGISNQNESWDDEVLKSTIANPVAKSMLGYEIAIPEEQVCLTYFDYNSQTYGFYHSDDLMISMFIVMRNIDCFLNFVGRPERVFRFKQSVEDIDHYILAEPKKFKALAAKLQIPILDTLDETEFMSEVADYDIPPSLSTIELDKIALAPKVVTPITNPVPELHLSAKSFNENSTQKSTTTSVKPAQVESTTPLNSNIKETELLSMLELSVVICAVIAIIPWAMYCINTLLPAMEVGSNRIKLFILLATFPPLIVIGLLTKLRPLRGGELSKIRKVVFLIAVFLMWVIIKFFSHSQTDDSKRPQEFWDSQTELIEKACHGGQLDDDALYEAIQIGYKINSSLRCITKESYAKVQPEIKQSEAQSAKDKAEYEKERLAAEAKYKEEQALIKSQQVSESNTSAEAADSESAAKQQTKLPPSMYYRCRAPDGESYSYIKRSPCPEGDVQTIEEAVKPIMPRSPNNTGPIKCTSKEGNVSIQMGNCTSPDDYQQAL